MITVSYSVNSNTFGYSSITGGHSVIIVCYSAIKVGYSEITGGYRLQRNYIRLFCDYSWFQFNLRICYIGYFEIEVGYSRLQYECSRLHCWHCRL